MASYNLDPSKLNNILIMGFADFFFFVVHVLDARGFQFNMTTDLDTLHETLPSFEGEVPEGSFAWVGYTVNHFIGKAGKCVSMNLLWVVVLGTPED